MIELKTFIKISDILNSEGAILTLYKGEKNTLYLGSQIKRGAGMIYYSITKESLNNYLKSLITLQELYLLSSSFFVQHKLQQSIKIYLKEDFKDLIQCGIDYYQDIPNSMKSSDIEGLFGLQSN